MSYTTIAVIYNPNSTGSGEALARKLKTRIKARLPKQKVELIETEHPGHGKELAYNLSKTSKNPLIISSSGDGGYNDVVNGVMKAKKEGFHPTAGILPAGNANDHFNNLHDEDLVEQIVKGAVKNIDLLKISGRSKGQSVERYAHSYIGFGLTPIVGNELNKEKLNLVKEFFIVARSLFKVRPVQLMIHRKVQRYESIVFSNVDVMSKYLKISQPSSLTDGKFEVTIFRKRSKLSLIFLLLQATTKPVQEDAQVKKFVFRTIKKTLVQADGEIFELDPDSKVRISIEKQVLPCVV